MAEALEKSGKTLKEIAERIHVHSSYLSRIKKGAIPSRVVLEGLIRELNLNREEAYRLYKEALEERTKESMERGLKRWELAAPAREPDRVLTGGGDAFSFTKLLTETLGHAEEAERFFSNKKFLEAATLLLGKKELSTLEKCILYQVIQSLKRIRDAGK